LKAEELIKMMNNLGSRLIEFHVLTMLNKKPMHGYAVMTTLNKQLKINVGPSTVYPQLYKLEHNGLVASKWNMDSTHHQKIYALTPRGKTFLIANAQDLKILVAPLLIAV